MKKNIFQMLLLLMTVTLTAACSSDSETTENASPAVINPDEALTPIRITANYAGDDVRSNATRVSYSEDGSDISATWQAGDKIKVVYNGNVSTLDLESGAGTASATFTGTISGTPSATSMLICYVSDQNNTSAVTINSDGSYTYTDGTFLAQDGTLAGAAKCNLYYGATFYGTGEDISCDFAVNTSMMKFTIFAPDGVSAGDEATLTYKSNGTAISKATFTVGAGGKNTIYLTIPAGQYTGEQTLVYNETSETLSSTKANFVAGETYSKTINYGPVVFEATASNFLQKLSEFNNEETSDPILRLLEDYSSGTGFTITRADGLIDLNGHTINIDGGGYQHIWVQNNELGKSLTFTNGTLRRRMDGGSNLSDSYYGTVIFKNVTYDGELYTDGHLFEMINVNFANGTGVSRLENYTYSYDYPSQVIIRSGKYNCDFHASGTISGLSKGYTTIYGGKFSVNPSLIANVTIPSGYSVKSNTDDDAATYPYIVSAD